MNQRKDKPRAKRFKLKLPVHFREAGERDWNKGTTVNLSCSGLLLRTRKSIQTFSAVEIVLEMPPEISGDSTHFFCTGYALRSRKSRIPLRASEVAVAVLACQPIRNGVAERLLVTPNARSQRELVNAVTNMVAVILGNSELIMAQSDLNKQTRSRVVAMQTAARRVTSLLHQLAARSYR